MAKTRHKNRVPPCATPAPVARPSLRSPASSPHRRAHWPSRQPAEYGAPGTELPPWDTLHAWAHVHIADPTVDAIRRALRVGTAPGPPPYDPATLRPTGLHRGHSGAHLGRSARRAGRHWCIPALVGAAQRVAAAPGGRRAGRRRPPKSASPDPSDRDPVRPTQPLPGPPHDLTQEDNRARSAARHGVLVRTVTPAAQIVDLE